MKLSIELVPATSWYNNLRKILPKSEWDILRKEVYKKADYKCEICSGRGSKWPVECHEIWRYDDKKYIQYLDGMIALCPDCHQVKHIGLAELNGHYNKARKHLANINNISIDEAEKYIRAQFRIYQHRSEFEWIIKSNVEGIKL